MQGRVRIRIRYGQRSGLGALVILSLLVAAFLGYLAWGQQEVAASDLRAPQVPAAPIAMRRYYLTTGGYDGSQADGSDGNGAGVCAAGYHFASLWEILDPSNLEYNTNLGTTADDSGKGPPTMYGWGWVRTGYSSDGGSTPGSANCYGWDSTSGKGTNVTLSARWGVDENMSVWRVAADDCTFVLSVWCVEDDIGEQVYLPLILCNS